MIRRAVWIAAAAIAAVAVAAGPTAWPDVAGPADGGPLGSGAAPAGPGPGQLLNLPVEAGAPEVNAAAYPTVVKLGARFTLYVTATFGPGVEVNLREPLDLGRAFEVRRRLSEDRRAADRRTTREWQVDVMAWELGELQVAPIAITFTAFGRAGQVETNAVPLKIVGVLGDTGEIADARSVMRGLAVPTRLTMRDWLWIWLAAAAAAIAGGVALALWLRRRRARRTLRLVGGAIARPRRIDAAGQRALERLLAIERSGVLERDRERKAGYAEMVDAIREYLAARYRMATPDLTSSELIGRLGRHAPRGEVERIAGWLDGCDLVKYGGQRATPAEAGKALDDARALIVATTVATAEPRGVPGPGAGREAA